MMQPAVAYDLPLDGPARDDVETRETLRSPGLALFRRDPFRLLRLDISATAEEAVWKAEKAQALARAGLSPTEPDLLSWLPEGDELELQQAVQALEEPLRRLTEQLAWFDLVNDPMAGELRTALETQSASALNDYLNLPDATEGDLARVARRLNKANLRLLAGFSAMYGVGPELTGGTDVKPTAKSAGKWAEVSGLKVIGNVHEQLGAGGEGSKPAWQQLLQKAMIGWGELLVDDLFKSYVLHQIRELRDERVSEDDVETIYSSITSRLADITTGEIKQMMMSGRQERVALLSKLVAASGIDTQIWSLSFRPLRHLFEAELADLEKLISDSAPTNLENVSLYLTRLSTLRQRWEQLDTEDLLGLNEIIDDAVMRGFDRLRNAPAGSSEHADRLRKALKKALETAVAGSVKERIKSYFDAFNRYRQWSVCAYCQRRSADEPNGVVVTGRKVTNVTRGYNSTTTTYSIRAAVVPRCAQCADYQRFRRSLGWYAFVAGVLGALILPWSAMTGSDDTGFLMAIAGGGLGLAALIVTRGRLDKLSGALTKEVNVSQQPTVTEMVADGYGIHRTDDDLNAAKQWNAQEKGGEGWSGNAWRVVGYLALTFGLLALRVCAASGRH